MNPKLRERERERVAMVHSSPGGIRRQRTNVWASGRGDKAGETRRIFLVEPETAAGAERRSWDRWLRITRGGEPLIYSGGMGTNERTTD